uniref:Coat protein n=1 Tax=Geladintestivirus 2 TaxID=3233134 RepID=A0AAU8ML08_9CAUD
MEKKLVIESLLKKGAELVKDVKVRNVTVTPQENYVRLGITIDKSIKSFVTKDEGVTYEEGETKVIFISLFSVASILKDNDDVAFAVDSLIKNPDSIKIILSRATINIIQEYVTGGEQYVNPWSDNPIPTVIEHDAIINHIIDIKLSEFALKKIDKLADAMLGI